MEKLVRFLKVATEELVEKLVRFRKAATDDIPADLGLLTKPLSGGLEAQRSRSHRVHRAKVAVRVREECAGVSGRLWTYW